MVQLPAQAWAQVFVHKAQSMNFDSFDDGIELMASPNTGNGWRAFCSPIPYGKSISNKHMCFGFYPRSKEVKNWTQGVRSTPSFRFLSFFIFLHTEWGARYFALELMWPLRNESTKEVAAWTENLNSSIIILILRGGVRGRPNSHSTQLTHIFSSPQRWK